MGTTEDRIRPDLVTGGGNANPGPQIVQPGQQVQIPAGYGSLQIDLAGPQAGSYRLNGGQTWNIARQVTERLNRAATTFENVGGTPLRIVWF